MLMDGITCWQGFRRCLSLPVHKPCHNIRALFEVKFINKNINIEFTHRRIGTTDCCAVKPEDYPRVILSSNSLLDRDY